MNSVDDISIKPLRPGANQIGVRNHNERLILTMIHRYGEMSGSDIAKKTDLSAQTVSNILRKLESDGFVLRRQPQRGRVGKPSVPMALDPDGALSFGLKVGRRSADLAVMNMNGDILDQTQTTYRYPMPDEIFSFLGDGMARMRMGLSARQVDNLCGIGIAAPSELWSWSDALGAPEEDFSVWKETEFSHAVARISDLPLFTENDATAAARAEHAYGRGREFHDYAYIFIGSFIGGGIVLNGSVLEGPQRNAGAIGPLRIHQPDGSEKPLLDTASLYLLEAEIARSGGDTAAMWHMPQDWSDFAAPLDVWIENTGRELGKAAQQICSVIDFEVILIDGAFPTLVRHALVERARKEVAKLDMRGLVPPRIEEASVGGNARVLGAASNPIFSQFFLV